MPIHRILSAVALVALLSGSAALAADPATATAIPGGPPEVKTSGNVRYVSGGIGQTEEAAMHEMAPHYSLNLLFATRKGRYMSGVEVNVTKANGENVLSTISDGPMLLVDLPPGLYTVEVAAEGKSFSRKVKLGKGQHRQVVLRWPATAESETERTSRYP